MHRQYPDYEPDGDFDPFERTMETIIWSHSQSEQPPRQIETDLHQGSAYECIEFNGLSVAIWKEKRSQGTVSIKNDDGEELQFTLRGETTMADTKARVLVATRIDTDFPKEALVIVYKTGFAVVEIDPALGRLVGFIDNQRGDLLALCNNNSQNAAVAVFYSGEENIMDIYNVPSIFLESPRIFFAARPRISISGVYTSKGRNVFLTYHPDSQEMKQYDYFDSGPDPIKFYTN